MQYPRYLKTNILDALKISPVVLLIGARQVGKTTLMKTVGEELGMNYVTLDTLSQLAAAQEDPEGFINGITKPVIIDEVQRHTQLALPIKASVDQSHSPGLFGLTGSANPLIAPKLNDSLAGRMFILHMWPLAMCEIQQKPSQFLKKVLDQEAAFSNTTYFSRKDLIDIFAAGGYPSALSLEPLMRSRWYDNLLTTILERDIKDISNLTRPHDIAKLLNILSTRTSNLLNISELSRTSMIPYTTLTAYMVLLESLFLIIRQPAWHLHRSKRLIKMPKIYFGDVGLLINQMRIGNNLILENGRLFGAILENFVFLELKKLISWNPLPIDLYHYRTQTGSEVDLILETREGQIIGIEVKASETLSKDDWKGLEVLNQELGDKMTRQIILYLGKEVIYFQKNRLALPLSTLWES
jgi:uncharacterized protein